MHKTFRLIFIWLSIISFISISYADAIGKDANLVTRITNAYPVFSPDGSKIAYMSNADGDFDIYVISTDQRELTQLTDAPGRDGTPVWSPDGSKIAFQSFRDGHSQVYVMDVDGKNQINISNNNYHDEHPFWSTDGKSIIITSNRNRTSNKDKPNYDIYMMNADGSNVRQITNTPEIETYASWSPDGSKIVCRKIFDDGNWEVVIMDSDGSNPINLSNHDGVDGWPVFSPDGKTIAYTSEHNGNTRIFTMNLDSTNKKQITGNSPYDNRQPSWSPDGSKIVYSSYQWFKNQLWYEASEIYIIKVTD